MQAFFTSLDPALKVALILGMTLIICCTPTGREIVEWFINRRGNPPTPPTPPAK